jgi:Pyruvate/2-oxoacid:ferredoxin oxidoreductase delta subunit
VPPDRLGDYLRDFHDLLERYDYGTASLYGHFGQGCVHTRIPFVLRTAEGIAKYRSFVEESARLVVKYGGSLSGEHGDGQSRGELLPIMFGERVVKAFEQTKALFDPNNRMNPGKVVHPYKLDENLRFGVDYRPAEPNVMFAYPDDDHRFSRAAARCVGVGKCRGHESGVMCPSYRATGEEEHSTRGRARLLFEMVQGMAGRGEITDGWRSAAVHDALDLCLACKGCRSDCPAEERQVRATARSTSTWRPTRRSSCSTTITGGCGRWRTTRWAGSRCGPGWPRPRRTCSTP